MPVEPIASPTENILVERIVFGWWNTSLSPVGNERADEAHKKIAGDIVKWLVNDLKVDCLALGEVTDADLNFLREYSGNKSFSSYDGTLKHGRLQFDTGVIYDSECLSISDVKSVTSTHAGRNLKVANRIDFTSSDGSLFHIFVSHWPSRGQDENILTREIIAERLNDQVKEIYEKYLNPLIILLGDYNDDPFDKSISGHLPATRDRRMAKTKRGLFYNPFWRQLGESEPHTFTNTKKSAGGSYFYRSGTTTRWHTFDQILFSSAFLGGGEWHLNEEDTMILRTDYLIELVQDSAVFFDHLSVLSVIERKIDII